MKRSSDNLTSSLIASYLKIFSLILISLFIISITSFIGAKNSLTNLGKIALKNRVEMALVMMDSLEQQVREKNLSREVAQELFRNGMLNHKKSDNKTRGLNNKLELTVKAYMYAINSSGLEVMHPFKEGENISNITDARGKNVVQLIINESKIPKNNGIIHFWWKNPGENKEYPKLNAVGYFEPWDWYINVGCYDKDFYKPSYALLKFILAIGCILIFICFLMFKSIIKHKILPLKKIINSMVKISYGDLSTNLNISSKDELGYLANVFNDMHKKIYTIISKIIESSNLINKQILNVNSSTKDTGLNFNSIKESIEEISASISTSALDIHKSSDNMNELSSSIEDVKQNSTEIFTKVQEANTLNSSIINVLNILETNNKKNMIVAKETSSNIKNLLNKSCDIMKIINTLENISSQTNLLALNASIEAAHCGEAGKGFVVVANEVKNLSVESTQSTNEISKLINELTNIIDMSAKSVEKYYDVALSENNSIIKTKEILTNVLNFMHEIPINLENNISKINYINNYKKTVVSSIESVSTATDQISACAEEISTSSTEVNNSIASIHSLIIDLTSVTNDLKKLACQFKL